MDDPRIARASIHVLERSDIEAGVAGAQARPRLEKRHHPGLIPKFDALKNDDSAFNLNPLVFCLSLRRYMEEAQRAAALQQAQQQQQQQQLTR